MTKRLRQATAGVALLYAARRYYRNWGTTKDECRMDLPGDELVGQPAVQTTEGVWVDAPASAVWPWLVQMGQNRGGLYTYQALERLAGLHYRNADRIHPEWQHLAPGDAIRLVPKGWMGLSEGIALRVVDVIDQRSIVPPTALAMNDWIGPFVARDTVIDPSPSGRARRVAAPPCPSGRKARERAPQLTV